MRERPTDTIPLSIERPRTELREIGEIAVSFLVVETVPYDKLVRAGHSDIFNGYVDPRLAFGHKSAYGYLVWVFVALFAVGLVDLALSIWWLARPRRRAASAIVLTPKARLGVG